MTMATARKTLSTNGCEAKAQWKASERLKGTDWVMNGRAGGIYGTAMMASFSLRAVGDRKAQPFDQLMTASGEVVGSLVLVCNRL